MNANQLRTVMVSLDDIGDVWDRLKSLRDGQPLTALETGVRDEPAIANLKLVGEPRVVFDGFRWNVILFCTT